MIDFDALVLAPTFQTFGELVTYRSGTGAVRTLTGIFDEKFLEMRIEEDGNQVATGRPMLALRAAEIGFGLPTLSELFTVRGRLWRVSDPAEPDGKGHVRVPLQLATDGEMQGAPTPPIAPPAALWP